MTFGKPACLRHRRGEAVWDQKNEMWLSLGAVTPAEKLEWEMREKRGTVQAASRLPRFSRAKNGSWLAETEGGGRLADRGSTGRRTRKAKSPLGSGLSA